jgi:L-ascorbate metabolism protein UlaG (beta-lactamase superfamily)
MINHNDFDEWPTMEVRIPTAGGRLMTKYGNICAYVDMDGKLQVMTDMQVSDAASWESFGITDPLEQVQMEQKLKDLVDSIKGNLYDR